MDLKYEDFYVSCQGSQENIYYREDLNNQVDNMTCPVDVSLCL